MPARLITIPFSHYCEKARWALERAGLDHVEDKHLPIFHRRAVRRAGAGHTVPALVTSEREVVADSTDILRWCDAHGRAAPLFPAEQPAVVELEDDFDRHLGPAARRIGYAEVLPSKLAFVELIDRSGAPGWQRRAARLARPLVIRLLARAMRIDPAGVARSRAVIDETFARVAALLADGRPYLTGAQFTAADLTFAALAAPVLAPEGYAAYLPSTLPPSFLALRDQLRRTPAGAFGLRIYDRERAARPAPPPSVAR